jgi:hypothetical protein
MNNKENRIQLRQQNVKLNRLHWCGEFHEVFHALATYPESSPEVSPRRRIQSPAPGAVHDFRPSGDNFFRATSRTALIKNPPTVRNETGDGIGHTCD